MQQPQQRTEVDGEKAIPKLQVEGAGSKHLHHRPLPHAKAQEQEAPGTYAGLAGMKIGWLAFKDPLTMPAPFLTRPSSTPPARFTL